MAIMRGTVVSFDSAAAQWKATVRFDGSTQLAVAGIRTSRAIPAGDMVAGRRVVIDTGDHDNLDDAVVMAVYTTT